MKKQLPDNIKALIANLNDRQAWTRTCITWSMNSYWRASQTWDATNPDDVSEQVLDVLTRIMVRSQRRAAALAVDYRSLPEHHELWQALQDELHPYDLRLRYADDYLDIVGGEHLMGHITGVSVRWAKGEDWDNIYTC